MFCLDISYSNLNHPSNLSFRKLDLDVNYAEADAPSLKVDSRLQTALHEDESIAITVSVRTGEQLMDLLTEDLIDRQYTMDESHNYNTRELYVRWFLAYYYSLSLQQFRCLE
jgi:hypothetical protein